MADHKGTPTKKVKFKLAHGHTHAGEDKVAGEIIELRPEQAERLIRQTPPRGEVVG